MAARAPAPDYDVRPHQTVSDIEVSDSGEFGLLPIQLQRDPAWHLAVGRALRPLREQGVLIVGSGAITHNLRAVMRHPQGEPVPTWVTEFRDLVR